ncbi:potassium-transporting ATPase subunit KdpC [Novosphingobium sp.]|uniref:potassium-transporting ATPase subunit KdpC n=1 Tax=Novosphingobium sp. TaxID=1874826 RepID=UPI0038BA0A4C
MIKDFASALRPSLAMTGLFAVVLCGLYPALITGVAQAAFPQAANGSLIERDGHVVGSALLGQGFASDRYFHGRPSAAGANGYDPTASSGSNLGPASQVLHDRIVKDLGAAKTSPRSSSPGSVPPDLVTASASGLDPHISPEAALFQIDRVAQARGIDPARVPLLVDAQVEKPLAGFLGEPRVNVLALNLALDAATAKGASSSQ